MKRYAKMPELMAKSKPQMPLPEGSFQYTDSRGNIQIAVPK